MTGVNEIALRAQAWIKSLLKIHSGAVIVRMVQAKVEHTGEYKLTADNGHGKDEVRILVG